MSFADQYRRRREPTKSELLSELKNTAYSCATLNASVCASDPPQLYVITREGQPRPKCQTKSISRARLTEFRERYKAAVSVEVVVDHPLQRMLDQVNPVMNSFDLWELTTLYQEVSGEAYWKLEIGPLGVPVAIWPLPSQHVRPVREKGSREIVDYYEVSGGNGVEQLDPAEVIHFRYPDPRDPYRCGLAPLRACYEQASLMSAYSAMRGAIYDNHAMPSAIVSPADVLGEDEAKRYEGEWNEKFRRGGNGRIIIAEQKMRVDVLHQAMGDLAQLAEVRATFEDICNAFHVPIAFMTTNVNMANLQAAERQHRTNAIHPRLKRRDQKLNEQLIPWFDPSGRLFVASEDPTPRDLETELKRTGMLLRNGVMTVNEARAAEGLPPVKWGDDRPSVSYVVGSKEE